MQIIHVASGISYLAQYAGKPANAHPLPPARALDRPIYGAERPCFVLRFSFLFLFCFFSLENVQESQIRKKLRFQKTVFILKNVRITKIFPCNFEKFLLISKNSHVIVKVSIQSEKCLKIKMRTKYDRGLEDIEGGNGKGKLKPTSSYLNHDSIIYEVVYSLVVVSFPCKTN